MQHLLAGKKFIIEPRHGISNNVICATSKALTSQRIRAAWSEPLLVAWIFYECKAIYEHRLEFLT